jgi:hypothetical protein
MDYKTMEEPARIARLPHWKGLPVTFTTLVDDSGIPNFKATNDNVWVAKRDGLCAICGEKLDYWKAFMVTEDEAASQLIYDNPHHEECLRFAFNICPWLFYSKAKYSEASDVKIKGWISIPAHPDRQTTNERPKKLGIYICNRYDNVIRNRFRICKVPKAKRIEWIEGH